MLDKIICDLLENSKEDITVGHVIEEKKGKLYLNYNVEINVSSCAQRELLCVPKEILEYLDYMDPQEIKTACFDDQIKTRIESFIRDRKTEHLESEDNIIMTWRCILYKRNYLRKTKNLNDFLNLEYKKVGVAPSHESRTLLHPEEKSLVTEISKGYGHMGPAKKRDQTILTKWAEGCAQNSNIRPRTAGSILGIMQKQYKALQANLNDQTTPSIPAYLDHQDDPNTGFEQERLSPIHFLEDEPRKKIFINHAEQRNGGLSQMSPDSNALNKIGLFGSYSKQEDEQLQANPSEPSAEDIKWRRTVLGSDELEVNEIWDRLSQTSML